MADRALHPLAELAFALLSRGADGALGLSAPATARLRAALEQDPAPREAVLALVEVAHHLAPAPASAALLDVAERALPRLRAALPLDQLTGRGRAFQSFGGRAALCFVPSAKPNLAALMPPGPRRA